MGEDLLGQIHVGKMDTIPIQPVYTMLQTRRTLVTIPLYYWVVLSRSSTSLKGLDLFRSPASMKFSRRYETEIILGRSSFK